MKAKEVLAKMPSSVGASRGSFQAESGRVGSHDLLQALEEEVVELDKMDTRLLPAEMQEMTLEQQTAFIKQKKALRSDLTKKMAALSAHRNAFIEKKRAESNDADSFDARVLRTLRLQAAAKAITY